MCCSQVAPNITAVTEASCILQCLHDAMCNHLSHLVACSEDGVCALQAECDDHKASCTPACLCMLQACQQQKATHSLKTGRSVILVCTARRSRGIVYRVANSVEVLGACRQISHQCVVKDACMHATLVSVISLIGAQTLVPVNQL